MTVATELASCNWPRNTLAVSKGALQRFRYSREGSCGMSASLVRCHFRCGIRFVTPERAEHMASAPFSTNHVATC
jgi:hypothetical protein